MGTLLVKSKAREADENCREIMTSSIGTSK